MVEEGIVIGGYLKGAGINPFDSFFTILGDNPIMKGKPDDWISHFLHGCSSPNLSVSLGFTDDRIVPVRE